MKYYFYQKDGEKHGPFTYEELKSKRLLKTTYVWTEGMENWAEAYILDELKDILVAEPPPIMEKKENLTQFSDNRDNTRKFQRDNKGKDSKPEEKIDLATLKYDPTYEREIAATIAGVFFLLIYFGSFFTSFYEDIEDSGIAIINAVYRIVITVLVVNISGRQNRSKVGWGIFAFIFPTLALIIIGLLKKKIKKVRVDSFLNKKQKLHYCLVEANKYYYKARFIDSLAYLNKALEIDENNETARDLRDKVLNDLKQFGYLGQ